MYRGVCHLRKNKWKYYKIVFFVFFNVMDIGNMRLFCVSVSKKCDLCLCVKNPIFHPEGPITCTSFLSPLQERCFLPVKTMWTDFYRKNIRWAKTCTSQEKVAFYKFCLNLHFSTCFVVILNLWSGSVTCCNSGLCGCLSKLYGFSCNKCYSCILEIFAVQFSSWKLHSGNTEMLWCSFLSLVILTFQ